MDRYQGIDSAYDFLIEKERQNKTFKLSELASASKWSLNTCSTYISKKLNTYFHRRKDTCTTNGIIHLSKSEFRDLLSQTSSSVNDFSKQGILISKAKEFALLAVSIYNNPTIKFKSYGFIVSIIIAFTSLFHAIFEKKELIFTIKIKKAILSI